MASQATEQATETAVEQAVARTDSAAGCSACIASAAYTATAGYCYWDFFADSLSNTLGVGVRNLNLYALSNFDCCAVRDCFANGVRY